MSCNFEDCQEEIEGTCNSCSEIRFFCGIHILKHKKEFSHSVKLIDPDDLKRMSIYNLKLQINKCIAQIAKDTEEVIKALKAASNKAITALKETSKNFKSVTEFKPTVFHRERISYLIGEVGSISNDMEAVSSNKLKELSEEISLSAKELSDKNETSAINEAVVDSLKKELDEKEKILKDMDHLRRILRSLEEEKVKEKEEIMIKTNGY
jgi:hypothetical protein